MSRLQIQVVSAFAFLMALTPAAWAQAQSDSGMSGMHDMHGMSEEEMQNMGGMHGHDMQGMEKGMKMKEKGMKMKDKMGGCCDGQKGKMKMDDEQAPAATHSR
ncbi:hypothetical protein [Beijerinckia mobilis]|uniref:hypothetical protein n=1 Tax=Beijerinckia mobilis TaxID=231434 RepID=UPI000558307A|nr:hypothetical protein [Beijerinckia mobilis]